MAIRSPRSIYTLIEEKLRQLEQPTIVNKLMEYTDLREEALNEWGGKSRDVRQATNKLSDALGFMWRRGVLTRFPAPRETNSFARYAYTLAEVKEVPVKPILSPTRSTKSQVGITERDGEVEIEFDKFIVIVRSK